MKLLSIFFLLFSTYFVFASPKSQLKNIRPSSCCQEVRECCGICRSCLDEFGDHRFLKSWCAENPHVYGTCSFGAIVIAFLCISCSPKTCCCCGLAIVSVPAASFCHDAFRNNSSITSMK